MSAVAGTGDLHVHDLLVIGGGINGTGIAADGAGRGLDVVLCEMDDLASATSSASSKLIHGGLRYLEQYEFRLVREALTEREVLLRNAPHIVSPLRFQLPHRAHLRPRWIIRAGLFLYDFLGRRVTLPRSRSVNFDSDSPLLPSIQRGFEYYDALVDDSRLVVLNAMQARRNGAHVLSRTECVEAVMEHGIWNVTLLDRRNQRTRHLYTKVLINAAGPWVQQVADEVIGQPHPAPVRLVKGCHIIVPRIHPGSQAFILQSFDERVVFVIPYEDDYSLIGTTDENYEGDPALATITDAEINYLVNVVNENFKDRLNREDIIHHFAGVRPLAGSEAGESDSNDRPGSGSAAPKTKASEVSRDYRLDLSGNLKSSDRNAAGDTAPVLSVYGGKITTYRKLAEHALFKLKPLFPRMKPAWTAGAPLPGGRIRSRQALTSDLQRDFPWLPQATIKRWVRSYGSLSREIVDGVEELDGMGQHFGHGLYQCEVDYLVAHEWAITAEDVLWRRSKLGLLFSEAEVRELHDYLYQHLQVSILAAAHA